MKRGNWFGLVDFGLWTVLNELRHSKFETESEAEEHESGKRVRRCCPHCGPLS